MEECSSKDEWRFDVDDEAKKELWIRSWGRGGIGARRRIGRVSRMDDRNQGWAWEGGARRDGRGS